MNIKKLLPWLLLAGAVVTLIGLITGNFLFIFLVIPLGFLFRKKDPPQKE